MPLSPAQRITFIRECARLLDKYEWSEIDLVLGQFGASTSPYGAGTKTDYVVEMLKNEKHDVLQHLHHYLTSEAGGTRPGDSPWSSNRARLFSSHLAAYREEVGNVARSLERFGVECFVAHDSIEPSKEWQAVIEAGLSACDAMVAFLHPGFLESKWCDQEVGWAMGRRIPVLPLNYGIHPYGFLGKYQDHPALGKHENLVARFVAEWMSKTPVLKDRMAASLSYAFERSISWNHTRTLVPMLEEVDVFNDEELNALERAAVENQEVRQCDVYGTSGPDWVAAFVGKRRKPVVPSDWSDESPF